MKYLIFAILITVFSFTAKSQTASLITKWPGWAGAPIMPADPISLIPANTTLGTHTFSGQGYIFGAYKTGMVTVYVREMNPQGVVEIKPIMLDISGAQVDNNGIPKIGSQLKDIDPQGNLIVITIVQLTRSVVLKGNSQTDPNNRLNWDVRPYRIALNSGW